MECPEARRGVIMYDSDILCNRCGKNDSGIVHSGTDGIWLGVLDELHKICYDCGNAHAREAAASESR